MKKILICLLVCVSFVTYAQRKVEKLGRGIVALNRGGGSVYLSWRLLAEDPDNIAFNLYQVTNAGSAVKKNGTPITTSTNFLCSGVNINVENSWFVKPIIDGIEQAPSGSFTLPANSVAKNYLTIQLVPRTNYSVNHVYVGDLDGDGEYDYVVKRFPNDESENLFVEAYMRDGTHLWSIDIGPNVEKGASSHNPFVLVHDFDGDGKAEVFLRSGEGTVFGDGQKIPDTNNDGITDYRTLPGVSLGYVVLSDNCPEYLSMVDGLTGEEIDRMDNIDPGKKSDWETLWGDNYGHRMNMNFVGVAYLDGIHPSIFNARGEGGVMEIEAYDFKDKSFSTRWTWSARTNAPLPTGKTWRQFHNDWVAAGANLSGIPEGHHWADFHNIRVVDLDGDGKDEVSFGVNAMDDDGTPLYFADHDTGHGDRFVIADIDPTRDGLECYAIQQAGSTLAVLYDAANGERIKTWSTTSPYDVARGDVGDIDPNHLGMELWSYTTSTLLDCNGNALYEGFPHPALTIWWDGDLLRETLDAAGKEGYNPVVNKWNSNTRANDRYLTMYNEGGKYSTVCPYAGRVPLYGDIMGDWREEVVCTNNTFTELRIFTSPVVTNKRLYCLMQNPEYRMCINLKAYLPSTETDYYLGVGMAAPPAPPVFDAKCRWQGGFANNVWDISTTTNWNVADTAGMYTDGDEIMLDIMGTGNADITLMSSVAPAMMKVITPIDYTISGDHTITGNGSVLKSGFGTLTLNVDADYAGKTKVDQGTLFINKTLTQSNVWVNWNANIGGVGTISKQVTFAKGACIVPGSHSTPGVIHFDTNLALSGDVVCKFDLSNNPLAIALNDEIAVNGDLTLSGTNEIRVSPINEKLGAGTYTLFTYSGTLSGSISNLIVTGIIGHKYSLSVANGVVELTIDDTRDAAKVVWSGSGNTWDLLTSENWLLDGKVDIFAADDSVIFNAIGKDINAATLVGSLPVADIDVDVSQNAYQLGGTGILSGDANLHVSGSGTLKILGSHQFTGKVLVTDATLEVKKLDNAGLASSLGASASVASSEMVFTNATLSYGSKADDYTNRGMTLIGENNFNVIANASVALRGLISGSGSLVKVGAGTLMLSEKSNTYTGGLVVKEGTLAFGDDVSNAGGPGKGGVTLIGGALNMVNSSSTWNTSTWNIRVPEGANGRLNVDGRSTLTGSLTGSGTLTFWTPFVRTDINGNWSNFTGELKVIADNDGGDFRFNNDYGLGNAAVNFANNVYAYRNGGGNIAIGELSGTSGSHLTLGAWKVGSKNTNSVFDGVIEGSTLTKRGTGSLTLTNANTYTGGTTVDEGELIIRNVLGSATGTGFLTINADGVVSGTGVVGGTTRVNAGGTIAPGVGLGTLTFSGNVMLKTNGILSVELKAGTATCDKISISGTSTASIDGKLKVTNVGTRDFKEGDAFKIIDCSSISGAFTSIEPSIPGAGLAWDMSELTTNGVVKVKKSDPDGINENKLSASLFPNPAKDKLWISISDFSDEVVIEVVSVQGVVVSASHAISGKNVIDLSRLKAGYYLIKVRSNNHLITKSFIKE